MRGFVCVLIQRAGATLMALMLACTCLTRTHAQATTLTIRPLRDGGGLERGLNARLTTALARFLTDHAPKTVQVGVEGSPPSQQISSSLRYTVEGELSFTGGADETNARFLLVTRLFRESAPHALVGQWAGTADSLRSLTVNLRRDPRVHALGLVGETGSRIVACLNADAVAVPAQWTRLLSQLTTQNALWEIVSADDEARPLRQITAGHSFRLRSRRNVSCRAYLLLSDSANGLHLARLSEAGECWTVRKGQTSLSKAVLLPEGSGEAWIVFCGPSKPGSNIFNVVRAPGKRLNAGKEIHFLAARRSAKSSFGRNSLTADACVLRTLRRRRIAKKFIPSLQSAPAYSLRVCLQEQNEASVQMLNGVGNQENRSEPASALKQLLDEISHAPEGWRVQKLRITTPK